MAAFNVKFKEVRVAKQKEMDRIDERLGRVVEIQVRNRSLLGPYYYLTLHVGDKHLDLNYIMLIDQWGSLLPC